MGDDSTKKYDGPDKTIITSISGLLDAKPKKGYLFFLAGPFLGKFFPLEDGVTVLGRSPDADISINDSRISRKHLKIEVDGENVTIEDLKSTNGTYVNGEKILKTALKADDKIQVSPATIFKFSLADEDEKIAINELYELGVIDPLTSAYNKRYFTDRLTEELSLSRRMKVPMSLMMIDIDFFKQVNDTHGHLAGDHVLQKLCQVFQTMTRHEDIVARYGGEEFSIIIRNTDEDGARLLSERIRTKVSSMPVTFEEVTLNITISVGIATLNAANDYKTGEELIAAADRCLYHSKEHGRNRTTAQSEIK